MGWLFYVRQSYLLYILVVINDYTLNTTNLKLKYILYTYLLQN